jgi:hypothetical protein
MPDQTDINKPGAMLIDRLVRNFYTIVPEQYKTYCAFTSEIIARVLEHYGVPCKRIACQVWYTVPNHIYVVGFLGKKTPDKWDGHVVCCAENLLIDVATHHFEREFGLQAPWAIATPMFTFPTSTLAHISIGGTNAIWWQQAPEGVDIEPPNEPQELVMQYANKLINALDSEVL